MTLPRRGPRAPRTDLRRRALRRITKLLALGLLVTACSYQTRSLVPPVPQSAQTSQILARDGRLIVEPRSGENRVPVMIEEIPIVMRDAVVAIEDERFYKHDGVDITGLVRSAARGVTTGGISGGGSTITMQYVGNVFLDRTEQTAGRKLDEILLARQFEDQYSKEFILQQYLNWVFFGARSYGIEAAAQQYFDTSVSNVNLQQAALLAGLIQRPSALNPYENPEGAIGRRSEVLTAMLRNGMITEDEFDDAVLAPLDLAPEFDETEQNYAAPHFVEEVKAWFLNGEFMTDGWMAANPQLTTELSTFQAREDLLLRGGIRLRTTVDLDLQADSEAAINAILPQGPDTPEASTVVIEPSTGEILAMVGGRDFFGEEEFAKVNLAMGTGRQAGSSMKPLALAAALERGIPVNQPYDAPATIELQPPDLTEPWKVRGGSRTGESDLVDATVWSRNTVYAQLAVELGPSAVGDMAKQLGMTAEIAPVYASVLGTENVTTLDLATAYSTFANQGFRNDPVFVTEILNPDGTVFWRHEAIGERVLDTQTADQLSWVLSQVVERGTGRNADFGRPAAGKTGTAQNFADATFAGYTPNRAAAVWVGFPTGQISMVPCSRKTCTEEDPGTPIQVSGGSYPAQIWREVMVAAHTDIAAEDFPTPPASVAVTTIPDFPESVEVPDYSGLTIAEAEVLGDGTGLVLSPVNVPDDRFTPGTIINQSPAPRALSPGGAQVIVEIATEIPIASVPNVVGLGARPARREIQNSGFVVAESFIDAAGNSINPQAKSGTVTSQSPAAGTGLRVGSTISIVIQKPA